MKSKEHSTIWSHFSKAAGGKKGKCKHCNAEISYAGGSTNNMKRHMLRKHPTVVLTFERQHGTLQELDTEVLDEDGASAISLPSQNQQPKPQLQAQQSITQFYRKPPVRKVEQIDRQVLKMVAKGHHALRIVEEPEFRKLIELVSHCPGYCLPTRKTLSNSLLPIIHLELKNNIKTEIDKATAICLTTDGWTSRNNTSYIAITAHFIDDDAVLRSNLLCCDSYGEKHTSTNLTSFIQKVINEYNIGHKITAIVSDNAANIKAAIREGNWRGISCFAHSLNLIVQSSLCEISETITKVKKIVEFFNRSTQGLNKLKEVQKQMGLSELKLKQDVCTRWNSTYEMLQRLVDTRNAVTSTLALCRIDLMLPPDDWDIVTEIIPILKPFYQITVEISAEKNVTLSKVIVLVKVLYNLIFKKTSNNPKILAVIKILQKELVSRFGDLEKNPLYNESTLLDPRFKNTGFRNKEAYENAVKMMRSKIIRLVLPNSNEQNQAEPQAMTAINDDSIWAEYDSEFKQKVQPENNTVAALREVDKYLNEEIVDRQKDPLGWWKEHKIIYPRMYVYALRRLCIVATSVPCERIFSATGLIINDRRTLLKPNKVSSLVFLHSNM